MGLFCPDGTSYVGALTSSTPQTFSISSADPNTGVLRVAFNADSSQPYSSGVSVYFSNTTSGPCVRVFPAYGASTELFKIPAGVTSVTLVASASGTPYNIEYSLTVGQIV